VAPGAAMVEVVVQRQRSKRRGEFEQDHKVERYQIWVRLLMRSRFLHALLCRVYQDVSSRLLQHSPCTSLLALSPLSLSLAPSSSFPEARHNSGASHLVCSNASHRAHKADFGPRVKRRRECNEVGVGILSRGLGGFQLVCLYRGHDNASRESRGGERPSGSR